MRTCRISQRSSHRGSVFLWHKRDVSISSWCKGTVLLSTLHNQTVLETLRQLATARDMHAHVYARPVACGRLWFHKVVIRLRPARACIN